MKTPKYVLVVRMAAAAAVLAGSSLAVPAFAEAGQAGTTAATPAESTGSEPTPAALSDAGLAEAVRRDLGLTVEEFNAAGQLAKRAADAATTLRELPGYGGMSLKGGKIVVRGGGAELQSRIEELNAAGPTADFVLEGPGPAAAQGQLPALQVASSVDELFEAYVREVGPAGLQAVAYADGHFVIRTGGTNTAEAALPDFLPMQPPPTQTSAAATMAAADFVARYNNVQLEKGSPVTTQAAVVSDLFGGQGYVTDGNFTCSDGFGAYNRTTGAPLVLTAGHCSNDGASHTTGIEPATASKAGGATTAKPAVLAPLGTFGFSQFGGPGNTATTTNPGNFGTDIAVIKDLAAGIRIQPAVTKWRGEEPAYNTADPANPGPTAVKIIGAMAPKVGQPVCRSGRTTGWRCGTVDSVGIWLIPGPKSLPPNFANDLRAVRAFDSTSVTSDGGDSGGPWISGNFAVGTHTAAEKQGSTQLRAIAATLEDALKLVPDVQLQLFLNKPELVVPANPAANPAVSPGGVISGQVRAAPASAVAAGSAVRITVPGQSPTDVPVDQAGHWSFAAPATAGHLTFTAETVNGFSRSGAVTLAVDVSAPAAAGAAAAAGQEVPGAVPVPAAEPAGAGVAPQPYGFAQPGELSDDGAVSPAPPSGPSGKTDVVPEAQAKEPAAAPAAAPPTRSGQVPGPGIEWLLPAAGLAGGSVLLAAGLLIQRRRRAVRAALTE
ncbi:peptidase [Arthrobacter sp. UKPF54-2]|uniref:S1 family peptidase n=1 Tax=Arthrobacter sp. UKPF54-2 TaxID=2600159 RepID=UPI0011B17A97|nr:S1 family peptidase [Arthrobacter sp. UKPF54-2]QDY90206.1 peptidase [Arthrobacter sp. UKPF54-2]